MFDKLKFFKNCLFFSGLATETTSVAYSSNHGASTGALYQRNPNPTTYVTPGDRGNNDQAIVLTTLKINQS